MLRTFERSGASAIAAGALVPLLPGALIAWRPEITEGTSAALLVAAVALGCTLGGLTAGIAAAVLATTAFARFVLPDESPAPHLIGFAVAATAVLAVYRQVSARTTGTERARAAAESRADALAERVTMLGPMLDTAPIGFALMDRELRVRYANAQYAEFTGIPVAGHLGRTPAELFGEEIGRTAEAVLAKVLETGETQEAVVVPVQWPRGMRWYLSNRYPISDPDGRMVGVGVGAIDITEKVTLEQEHQRALAEQHRMARLEAEAQALRATAELAGKLEQAQRLARLGSWEVDLRTGAVTGSAQMEAIVGEPAAFLAGTGTIAVHTDDAERMAREFRYLRAGEGPFAGEFRLVCPDGSVLDVYGTGEVIRDATGEPVRVWGTLQDVTAQRAHERAAEAAIRAADQARAQLEAEHRALQMFVQAMLPSSLPSAPDTEIVAAYLPVVERVDIGGDWFDSFPLPDGRFALAVGDVTGHDLQAATIMGQVRNAVRAYAFEDPSPGEVLRRVNQLLTRVPDLDLVTMVYGVYDPVAHELTWANAGHPAPLLRHKGEVIELDDPSGLILGVFADDMHYAESTVRLTPGDTVLVYTDGLVDHRAADPQQAMNTLVNLLAAGHATPRRLLAEVTDRMLAGDVQDDDVCLLALHRTTGAVPTQPHGTHDRVPPGVVVSPPDEPLPGPVAWAA